MPETQTFDLRVLIPYQAQGDLLRSRTNWAPIDMISNNTNPFRQDIQNEWNRSLN